MPHKVKQIEREWNAKSKKRIGSNQKEERIESNIE